MLSQLNQVHFSHHLIGYWVVDDIKESPKINPFFVFTQIGFQIFLNEKKS